MEINHKPKSVSIRSRPRDLTAKSSNLNQTIERYTTLKLQNMLVTSNNDLGSQSRTLAIDQIRNGLMSEQKPRDDQRIEENLVQLEA